MSSHEDIIRRYAGWLSDLSEKDQEYVRARRAEVAEICAADPNRERWLQYMYEWTLAGIEAEGDPVAAIAAAVAATVAEPEEIGQAILAIEKIADEWEETYRPASKIVGEPYPQSVKPTQNRE